MRFWEKRTLGTGIRVGWVSVLGLFTAPVSVNGLDIPGRRLKKCHSMSSLRRKANNFFAFEGCSLTTMKKRKKGVSLRSL